ncbi:hypothetical protein [Cohnella nanjingensis]|uniref:hypothetical protein n=1 Tax=Cohnella nanjingensis TaxID=1387779 RepID=UPI0024845263|nr:hypothetical protein [Cohnella nanjingensis]
MAGLPRRAEDQLGELVALGQERDGPARAIPAAGPDNVTIAPGQTVTITKPKTFTATDPKGAWYAYLTYVTPDGVYHDGTNVDFTVTT